VRRRGQDGAGERCPESRAPGGGADLVLVDVPFHVFAGDIEPDRCRVRAGCPPHWAAGGVEVERGQVLFEAQAGQVEQLDEQGRADPPGGIYPLLVEGIEPGVWILSLVRAQFPAVSPHRDVAELDSEQVRGDRMDRPAGAGRRERPVVVGQAGQQRGKLRAQPGH
jgi:hypothetical protein